MSDAVKQVLTGWENFYVIVGSSAAALIGLQFVVIALIRDTRTRTTSGSISAFGTPTVVHLGSALIVSAVMSAPWPSLVGVSIMLTLCGLVGLGHGVGVIRHTRIQTLYEPLWQDWLWYGILPCIAYGTLTLAALWFRTLPTLDAFFIAAAALGLLLIAIHNAWDTVTFIAIGQHETEASEAEPQVASPV